MVSLPNIYKSRHLRYFIMVPLALLVLGVYFSTRIVYDSSLSGGVSIVLQTNSSLSSSKLASELTAMLHVPNPNIEKSPGGVQITLSINQSLAGAERNLLDFYAFRNNYTAAQLNATAASLSLRQNPGNQTLKNQLNAADLRINNSLSGMAGSLNSELSALAPFIGSIQRNSTDPDLMLLTAQNAYSNASTAYEGNVISTLHGLVPFTTYSYQQLTPTLGRFFLQQLRLVIIIAFLLISVVVFIIFRSPAPAFAVIFGSANDIIVALGAMGLFQIPLGIASIGGLLMLIGYSIDTDVLTAVRIIKRHEGTPEDRAYASMRTGLTMTITAIVSFGVLFAVSVFTYVPTYYEIAGVVLFGLIGDVFTTWFGNASIVLLYTKGRERRV